MANWLNRVGLRRDQDFENNSGIVTPTLSNNSNSNTVNINGNVNGEGENSTGRVSSGQNTGSGGRRPRGRPPGSRNKAKPPVVITRETPNALRSHILEIADGNDIVACISNFANVRHRGVSIHCGSGAVSNVTLRQRSDPTGNMLVLAGRYELVSLSGAFLPPPSPPSATGLSVYITGAHGQLIGGIVVGGLVACGPVMIVASTFANATYERLPLAIEEEQEANMQEINNINHVINNNIGINGIINNHNNDGGSGSGSGASGSASGSGGGGGATSHGLAEYNLNPNLLHNGVGHPRAHDVFWRPPPGF
ncbi:AT-hook motif nuclear-localized protein 20-like [Trifolium pratense]|uniref:AT-hook motif nuclear-localized protein 20-like n=1 Tax=Trifolium pratense TaxID=57577 RepID=UPI001E693AE3|nr:AT-hook motif nuclear-localized protein 20-like [Trifolium pratense]XP_045786930.1 AT-hook motif nuclear-localized protein 20-like [Trifolium pratense]